MKSIPISLYIRINPLFIPISLYIRINPLTSKTHYQMVTITLSHCHTGNRQPINHNIALLCVISSGVNLPRGNHPVWSVGEPGSINHNLIKMIFLSLEFWEPGSINIYLWEPGSINHNLKKMIFLSLEFWEPGSINIYLWEPGSINHNLKKMIFLSLEFWEPGSISHNLK